MSLLRAVIFDWAGTVVDYGSRAPMSVFRRAFEDAAVPVTEAEARGPMGLPKWYHIKAVGAIPRVREAWQARYAAPFSDQDVDRLHAAFIPLTLEAVADHADFVPGALDSVADARRRGLKIGSTTGYDRATMEALIPIAAAGGFQPDCVIAAGDLALGRPSPLMIYQCQIALQVWPSAAIVKLDDTVPGIAEGLAAGCWSVGVVNSGSLVGLSPAEEAALPADALASLRAAAAATLTAAGAHAVIGTIAELPALLNQIEARLAAGERPQPLWPE